jgi:hypothetical protein
MGELTPPMDTIAQAAGSLRPIRLAKWSALAVAAGAGIYGFIQNSRADEVYRALELSCQADPANCTRRSPNGAYLDPVLESRYQEVRSLDRKSHVSLLFSQVGVATSVVLFLLDLGNVRRPRNIPWTPPSLETAAGDDGRLSIGFRIAVPEFR